MSLIPSIIVNLFAFKAIEYTSTAIHELSHAVFHRLCGTNVRSIIMWGYFNEEQIELIKSSNQFIMFFGNRADAGSVWGIHSKEQSKFAKIFPIIMGPIGGFTFCYLLKRFINNGEISFLSVISRDFFQKTMEMEGSYSFWRFIFNLFKNSNYFLNFCIIHDGLYNLKCLIPYQETDGALISKELNLNIHPDKFGFLYNNLTSIIMFGVIFKDVVRAILT